MNSAGESKLQMLKWGGFHGTAAECKWILFKDGTAVSANLRGLQIRFDIWRQNAVGIHSRSSFGAVQSSLLLWCRRMPKEKALGLGQSWLQGCWCWGGAAVVGRRLRSWLLSCPCQHTDDWVPSSRWGTCEDLNCIPCHQEDYFVLGMVACASNPSCPGRRIQSSRLGWSIYKNLSQNLKIYVVVVRDVASWSEFICQYNK